MNQLYHERRRTLTEAGFTIHNVGANAAAVWPKEMPENYPNGVCHPRVLAWLFHDNGSLLYPKTHDPILVHYQTRLRRAVSQHHLDLVLG